MLHRISGPCDTITKPLLLRHTFCNVRHRGLIFNYASKLWRADFDRMKIINLLDGQRHTIEREASRPPALIKSAYAHEDSVRMMWYALQASW